MIMATYNLDELSALLFGGTRQNSVNNAVSNNQTTIIYGTALADSSSGLVSIQLDTQVYSADDEVDDDYVQLSLSEDDDVDSIDEDEELIEEEQEQETVFWDWQDDDATEQDE